MDYFVQLIREKLYNNRSWQQAWTSLFSQISLDKILQKLKLLRFTPFSGSTCKLQLWFVKMWEKLSWNCNLCCPACELTLYRQLVTLPPPIDSWEKLYRSPATLNGGENGDKKKNNGWSERYTFVVQTTAHVSLMRKVSMTCLIKWKCVSRKDVELANCETFSLSLSLLIYAVGSRSGASYPVEYITVTQIWYIINNLCQHWTLTRFFSLLKFSKGMSGGVTL